MPKARILYSLICEDVRKEASNKLALLGAYANVVVVDAEFPVVLKGLALVTAVALDSPTCGVKYRLELPEVPPEEFEGEPLRQESAQGSSTSVIQLLGIQLKAAGQIRLTMTFEDGFVHELSARVVSRAEYDGSRW